jgi:hypothetical protein
MERNMRITDYSSIVQVIRTVNMGQKTMEQEHISLFSNNRLKLFAVLDVLAVGVIDRRIQTLWVIV